MKKSLLFSIISCLFISMQPLMAMETAVEKQAEPAIEQQEAKPSAVLSWWRSLRRPTQQDRQNVKDYVNSKYRCLRYGEGCSRKERAKLVALAALVGVAVGATAWKAKKFIDKKFIEKKWILKEESRRWFSYAFDGNFENIKKLIDAGIDVNIQNNRGNTALMLAAHAGHVEIVRELLAAPGIEVNKQDNNGNTALMEAAYGGDAGIVQQLLKAPGIDVNKQDSNGITALMEAAYGGHVEIVRELLADGAEVNKQNNSGVTALMVAARWGHAGIVRELLADGAEVNKQNNSGVTALMLAAQWGHADIVRLLLEAGADYDYDPFPTDPMVQEALEEIRASGAPRQLLKREIGM